MKRKRIYIIISIIVFLIIIGFVLFILMKNNVFLNKNETTKIDDGLVVIAPDGSEFVWIPVDNHESMYGIKENGDYYGKLYQFNDNGIVEHLNWYEEIEVTDEQLQEE